VSECGVTGCGIPDNHGHGSSSGVTVECSGCAILRAEVERLKRKAEADIRYLRGQYDSIVEILHRKEAEREQCRMIELGEK